MGLLTFVNVPQPEFISWRCSLSPRRRAVHSGNQRSRGSEQLMSREHPRSRVRAGRYRSQRSGQWYRSGRYRPWSIARIDNHTTVTETVVKLGELERWICGSCPREGDGKGKLIRILFSVYFGGFRG